MGKADNHSFFYTLTNPQSHTTHLSILDDETTDPGLIWAEDSAWRDACHSLGKRVENHWSLLPAVNFEHIGE